MKILIIYIISISCYYASTHSEDDHKEVTPCGNGVGCYRIPADCTSKANCIAVTSYFYNKSSSSVVMELITKQKWVAIGHKKITKGEQLMIKLRGQYCLRGSPTPSFGNFHGNDLTRNTKPHWEKQVDGIVLKESKINQDGTISCRFERPVVPSAKNAEYLYDLNEELTGVLAHGTREFNGYPGYHGRDGYTSATINFLDMGTVRGTDIPLDNQVKVHGVLMIIAWMLLATFGIFMPRYMKDILKEKKILKKAAWFSIHQLTMILCVLFFILGLVFILIHTNGKWSEFAGTHHWLGLFTIIFGLAQPVMAMLRPDPTSEKRYIFNWMHRVAGFVAWILGELAIILGLSLTNQTYAVAIVFAVLIPVLFIILDLIQYLGKGNKTKKSDSSDMNEMKGETEKKGFQFEWLFLILVVVLSLVMAIYHVVIVATGEK